MQHLKQPPPVDGVRAQRLSNALSEVDRLVQQSCAEIAALAELSLAWLELAQGHRSLETVARALQTMRSSAGSLASYSHGEAKALDCEFVDRTEVRRSEAAKVAQEMDAGLIP